MLNKIFLMGRLTRDPELRHTQSGMAVASFRLAVDRDFKDQDTGDRKADFIDVVAWRQTGEFVSRYFTKGRMAVVEGTPPDPRLHGPRTATSAAAPRWWPDNVYFGDSSGDADIRRPARRLFRPCRRQLLCSRLPAAASGAPAAPTVDQFAELSDDDGGALPF